MAKDDDDVTEAHDQRMTVHILTQIPIHEPVPGDPHYDLFVKAKARMKRQGLWKCAINDDYCGGDIELHHTHIEASEVTDADLHKVNEAFGLHLDSDEDFQDWIESPGNLEPLCVVHHRTHYGVHILPNPLWEPLRYRKHNAKPAAEVEMLEDAGDGAVATATKTRTTRAATATATKTAMRTTTTVAEKAPAAEHHPVPRQRTASEASPRKKERGFWGRLFGRD